MASVKLGSKAVGSIVKIKVNGTLQEFIVVHQGRPSTLYDESCSGTWLLMKSGCGKRAWDNKGVNDYSGSSIHAYLNSTVLSQFDSDIQTHVKQVKIPYILGNGVSGALNSGSKGLPAKVFLLSAPEVGDGNRDDEINDGSELEYFKEKNDKDRILETSGKKVEWWLRSPIFQSTTVVHCVTIYGYVSVEDTSKYSTICPALILPPDLFVCDDGSIAVNTAPTTPASITVPETIQSGILTVISWEASTDSENNLEGYIVERSTDGGSTWIQIYRGSGCSTSNSVPFGISNVIYRVKSYDSEGLQSSWRTSSQVNVHNNTAPTVPMNINVPNSIIGGEPLTITWGQSTDIDNDPISYILERQTDGGTWTKLYEGIEQTYTDSIMKGWKTVSYRVKACDSYNSSSAYVTSETRTVNNNAAPTISGQDTTLGLKTGSFSQSYTVSDADNNAVTVTEYVDNQTIRSYQAVLGQEAAVTLSHENWLKLSNGEHQLRVTAYDGIATATRIWTFSKKETVICFQLAAPIETDAAAAKILVSPTWKIDGATARVEACNNAFDATPAWEDITAMLALKRVYHFTNTTKTADKWGLDIRFTIEKNEGYDGEVSITGFGAAYE